MKYREKEHEHLPHVIKFSGGRSSGMMLMNLLDKQVLRAERGDFILFNNTSAEHPMTYVFVDRVKQESEKHGIPFFLNEFHTVEDIRRKKMTRVLCQRLVNSKPKTEDNPDGFHWQGEVFEEMLSWKVSRMPDQFERLCTMYMKVDATNMFMDEWVKGEDHLPFIGNVEPQVDIDTAYEMFKKNGGTIEVGNFKNKKTYCLSRPSYRPEQKYKDYSQSWVPFAPLQNEFVSFLGIRGDEPRRFAKFEAKNYTDGREHHYLPLVEDRISNTAVMSFWSNQEFDLQLESHFLSNCTFCFMKGKKKLQWIYQWSESQPKYIDGFGSIEDTPSDFGWWGKMDSIYGKKKTWQKYHLREKFYGFSGEHPFGENILSEIHEDGMPCTMCFD